MALGVDQEEDKGSKDPKIWASSQLPPLLLQILVDLPTMSLDQIRLVVGQLFVAEDARHGWLR